MTQLPEWDQEDQLVAIARDPRTIFVYWEITEQTRIRKESASLLPPSWGLRLTDMHTGAVSDIAVNLGAEQHYCSALPGHSYHVQMGLRRGKFHAVLDGGIVELPKRASAGVSSWSLAGAFADSPLGGPA